MLCSNCGRYVDSARLKGLMEELGKRRHVDESEVRLIMIALGMDLETHTVTIVKFEAALGKWLCETRGAASPGKKRKAQSVQQSGGLSPVVVGRGRRRRVHADIVSFFTQFRPLKEVQEEDLVEWDDDGAERKEAAAKIERLTYIARTLAAFPSLVDGARSSDAAAATEAVGALERMLQVVEVFPSPGHRYLISPILIQLFEAVTHALLPQRLVEILSHPDTPLNLRRQTCRALRLYAQGPRIAHTPPGSHWHTDSFLAKRIVVENGGVPPLLAIIAPQSGAPPELRVDALEAISAIAEDNVETLQLLHSQGLGGTLAALLAAGERREGNNSSNPFYVEEMRAASYAFAVLCGHTHSGGAASVGLQRGAAGDPVSQVLRVLTGVLEASNDPEVLSNICTALALVMAVAPAELELLRMLMVKLQSTPSHIRSPLTTAALLSCVHVALTPYAAHSDVANALLPLAYSLQQEPRATLEVRSAALQLLADLMDANAPAVVSSMGEGVVIWVLSLIRAEDELEARACEIVNKLASGIVTLRAELPNTDDTQVGSATMRALIANRAVPLLFGCLRRFRIHDAVLRDAYNYQGPTSDTALVIEAVRALRALLVAGEAMSAACLNGNRESPPCNPFLSEYGKDAVECLRELIKVVLEERRSGRVDPWRYCENMNSAGKVDQSPSDSGSNKSDQGLEAEVGGLATDMLKYHEIAARAGMAASLEAGNMLTSLLQEAQAAAALIPPQAAVQINSNAGAPGATAGANTPIQLNVTITPLNFEGTVRTVLVAGGAWQEVLRQCTVMAGRSVDLLYLSADKTRHVAVSGQDDIRLAAALAASEGHPGELNLFMRAQFTQKVANSVRCATAPVPPLSRKASGLDLASVQAAMSNSSAQSSGRSPMKRRSGMPPRSSYSGPSTGYHENGHNNRECSVNSERDARGHKKQRSCGERWEGNTDTNTYTYNTNISIPIHTYSADHNGSQSSLHSGGDSLSGTTHSAPGAISTGGAGTSFFAPSHTTRPPAGSAADDSQLFSGSSASNVFAAQSSTVDAARSSHSHQPQQLKSAGSGIMDVEGLKAGLRRTKKLPSRVAFVGACEELSLSPRGTGATQSGSSSGGASNTGGQLGTRNTKNRSWKPLSQNVVTLLLSDSDSEDDEAADMATTVPWGAAKRGSGGASTVWGQLG